MPSPVVEKWSASSNEWLLVRVATVLFSDGSDGWLRVRFVIEEFVLYSSSFAPWPFLGFCTFFLFEEGGESLLLVRDATVGGAGERILFSFFSFFLERGGPPP